MVKMIARASPSLLCLGFIWAALSAAAVMLPLGSELTAAVNEWLAPQLATGRISDQLEQAVRQAQ